MDNIIENAYQYGRTSIETYLDDFLKDADKEQRRKLKDQILSIWDRMIQYWMDKQKGHGPMVPSTAITDSIGEIVYNEGESASYFPLHTNAMAAVVVVVVDAIDFLFRLSA